MAGPCTPSPAEPVPLTAPWHRLKGSASSSPQTASAARRAALPSAQLGPGSTVSLQESCAQGGGIRAGASPQGTPQHPVVGNGVEVTAPKSPAGCRAWCPALLGNIHSLSQLCPAPVPQSWHRGSSRSSQSWRQMGPRPLRPAGSHLRARDATDAPHVLGTATPVTAIAAPCRVPARGLTGGVVVVGATEPPCAPPQLSADRHVGRPTPVRLHAHAQPALHGHEVPEPGDADPCGDRTRVLSRARGQGRDPVGLRCICIP